MLLVRGRGRLYNEAARHSLRMAEVMQIYVCALAAVAAMSVATATYAGEAAAPKPMTDEQMDKVTAAGGGQHLIITSSGGNGEVVHQNCTGQTGSPSCAGPIFPSALGG